MLDRRCFTAAMLGLLAGCGQPSLPLPEATVSIERNGSVTDDEVRTFLEIVRQLPDQKPPAFQPISEVDLTTDVTAAQMAARWQREFQSSYSPEVQARLWKRNSRVRGALHDCQVDPADFATLLVNLSTAVVRQSLDPNVDLPALGRQADGSIASLCHQFDSLQDDTRLSPSLRNSRAELLCVVLKETVAFREFLKLLERVDPESIAVVSRHAATLRPLMPATETVQMFRRKLESQSPVIQAGHSAPTHRPE